MTERRIDVALGFTVHTLTNKTPDEVARDLASRLVYHGNPLAAPEAVVLIRATEVEWTCEGCGATTGRYDNGDACDSCVMASFAEGG